MRRGKLIGLGVGPGDPDLLTLRAVRALERAPAIAFIAAAGRASRAREIAGPHIKPGTRELIVVMPMSQEAGITERAYTQLVTGIISELVQGNDVVFLCEGDPLLYGSFANLLPRLGSRFACEVIPGITAMTAAAAASLTPLAQGEETLTLIPATVPEAHMAAMLKGAQSVVVMKVGRHLEQVKGALAKAGMLDGALLVENATTASERIRPLAGVREAQAPYFSLILARRPRGQG